MILILSRESYEMSTEQVIDWIDSLGGKYIRLNAEDMDSQNSYAVKISNEDACFGFNSSDIKFSNKDINVVWYRRWYKGQKLDYLKELDAFLYQKIRFHLNSELLQTSSSLFRILENAIWIDHPRNVQLNKLHVLLKAKHCQLQIPDTLITNDRSEVEVFLKKKGKLITKSVSEGASYLINDTSYVAYTSEIDLEKLGTAKSFFYPSLFQEKLEKKYELRIFYLNGRFYSMAIFSQENEKTKIDFRQYDFKKPNRFVPYKLPESIEIKLHHLMISLELKCGSIDMVRTLRGEYFFLEVNPVGQFGMVSKPCNYYLEKDVAKFLIENDRTQ